MNADAAGESCQCAFGLLETSLRPKKTVMRVVWVTSSLHPVALIRGRESNKRRRVRSLLGSPWQGSVGKGGQTVHCV